MNSSFFIIFLGILSLIALWRYITNFSANVSAPFIPTEPKIIKRMLDIAHLKKNDILYDLGSGDGRIIIMAALRGIKAVGIEIDPIKVWYSRLFIKIMKLEKKAKIERNNFFNVNLSRASVITIFLHHEINQLLKEKFHKELKRGTRIISYPLTLEGWKPERIYINADSSWSPIYLYKIK